MFLSGILGFVSAILFGDFYRATTPAVHLRRDHFHDAHTHNNPRCSYRRGSRELEGDSLCPAGFWCFDHDHLGTQRNCRLIGLHGFGCWLPSQSPLSMPSIRYLLHLVGQKQVDAASVAHGQHLVVSIAALAGSAISGSIYDWHLVTSNIPAIGLTGVGEGLALLVYLELTRDYGPSLVSLANFISLLFAAMIGAVFFDDGFTWLSALAGLLLIAALTMRG